MIKVSAPGKIIISGEHSVVWGEPALLTAIDKRCWVEIEENKEKKIRVIDGVKSKDERFSFEEILDFTERIREDWEKFMKGGGEYFKKFKKDSLGLVKVSIGECLKHFRSKNKGFKLEIKNEVPIGRGLGSSAALAVSVVAGLGKFFLKGEKLPKFLIGKIAYEIEKRQHGNPSGGDQTICIEGGFLIFKRGKKKTKKKLKLRGELPKFLLIDTGEPLETTGEMVEKVELRIKNDELRMMNLMIKIGGVTEKIIEIFKEGKVGQLRSLIRKNERLLEELGAVGKRAQRIIRTVEEAGGAAKICGGGGLMGGSGMGLGYHQDLAILRKVLKENKIGFLKIELGGEGVKVH